MAILEIFRARASATPEDPPAATPADGPQTPGWRAPLLAGASTATIGLLAVLAVVGIVGSLAERATSSWGTLFGAGAAFWLMIGGSRLATDGVFVAMTPLLGTGALLWFTTRSAGRALPPTGPRRMPYAGWLAGYAAVASAAVALAFAGPAVPVWWSLPLPVLGIPAVALALAELPRGRWAPVTRLIPRVVRRATRPALQTSAALLLTGMTLVLLTVTLRLGEVGRLYAEVRPGLLGAVALTAAQVLAWPNLGLWALAFVSGPGFAVTDGSHFGVGAADAGLLPLIPVLGALPGSGDFGWYVALVLLVPVVIGGQAARLALAQIPRLASGRTKLAAVAATVTLSAALVAALDGVAGGSLGDGRLAGVGPSAMSLFGSLCLSLGVGALIVVTRDWWRLRR